MASSRQRASAPHSRSVTTQKSSRNVEAILAASAKALPPADKITPNRVFLPLLTTNHT
jgi:hypothetical protein